MSNNCPLNLIACTVQHRFSLWSVYTHFDVLRRLRQRLIRSLRRVINKKCSPSANYTFPKDQVLSHHFHIGHNAPCLPPTPLPKNFAQPSSSISLGMTVIPRRNWKQWLCKPLGVSKMHYGLCENGEWENCCKLINLIALWPPLCVRRHQTPFLRQNSRPFFFSQESTSLSIPLWLQFRVI